MSTPDVISEISLEQLHESPFNQRQIFASVDALAASIKSEGRVLEPLLVRPRLVNILRPDEHDGFEIVFGHRRARAAELAGLATVPCMVRALTPAQARSAQIAENLEREDVHPLEEAASFKALVDHDELTAEQIAERFGKSRTYVYGRLKLLQLHPEVRKACLAGEVGAEVALLLARLRTEKLQTKALGYIKADYHCRLDDGGKAAYRAVRELLNEKFTLNLKDAIFDTVDAVLLPDAGACTTCPKRSFNAPEFDDVTNGEKLPSYSSRHHGPDVCTDPDCFDAKKRAHLELRAQELQAKGKTVITGNAARSAISAQGEVKGAFVALADVKTELAKIKGRTAGGNAVEPPPVVAIQDPRTGKVVQAVRRVELESAGVELESAGVKLGSVATKRDTYAEQQAKFTAARKADEAKAAAEQKLRMAVLDRIRAAAETRPRDAFDLQLVARVAIAGVEYYAQELLATSWGYKQLGDLRRAMGQMSVQQLTRLVLDCALIGDVSVRSHSLNERPETLWQAAKHYGVDVAKVRAEASEGTSPPEPAARAPKKAATKPKRRTAPASLRGPVAGAVATTPIAALAKAVAADAAAAPKGRKPKNSAGSAGGAKGKEAGSAGQKQTDDAGVTAGGSVAEPAVA